MPVLVTAWLMRMSETDFEGLGAVLGDDEFRRAGGEGAARHDAGVPRHVAGDEDAAAADEQDAALWRCATSEPPAALKRRLLILAQCSVPVKPVVSSVMWSPVTQVVTSFFDGRGEGDDVADRVGRCGKPGAGPVLHRGVGRVGGGRGAGAEHPEGAVRAGRW